jgi:hypothetical protein
MKESIAAWGLLLSILGAAAHGAGSSAYEPPAKVIRSARSGPWSTPATWDGAKVPGAGDRVLIRPGHTVVYDVRAEHAIRMIHIAGMLTFAPEKGTLLNVGLIKIQLGNDTREDGFDCDAHAPRSDPAGPRPTLEVGTAERPIDPRHKAVIRLVYFDGMEKESCPAIVCCGGRMDFGGAPMSRTWVKLGVTAKTGEKEIALAEPVTGWRKGDRVILTSTTRQNKPKRTFRLSTRDDTHTRSQA